MDPQNQQKTGIKNSTPINNFVGPPDNQKRKITLSVSFLIMCVIFLIFLIFLVGRSAYILGQKSASSRFDEVVENSINVGAKKLPAENLELMPTNLPTIISPIKTKNPTTNTQSDWQTLESQSGYAYGSNEGLFIISYPTDICSVVSVTINNPNIEFDELRDRYLQCHKDEYAFKIYPFAGGAGVGKTVESKNLILGKNSWRRVLFKGPFTGNDFGVFYDTNIDGMLYYIQIHFGEKYNSDLLTLTDSIISTFKPL